MIGTHRAARIVIAALIALASGCQSFKDPMHHEDMFVESMRSFTQAIRWGNFGGAVKYLVEEQRDAFLELAPQLTDVRFTDYEILRQELNAERTGATVDVVLTGYRLTSPISRTVRLHQEWRRTDSNAWEVSVELEPMRKALGLAAQ